MNDDDRARLVALLADDEVRAHFDTLRALAGDDERGLRALLAPDELRALLAPYAQRFKMYEESVQRVAILCAEPHMSRGKRRPCGSLLGEIREHPNGGLGVGIPGTEERRRGVPKQLSRRLMRWGWREEGLPGFIDVLECPRDGDYMVGPSADVVRAALEKARSTGKASTLRAKKRGRVC
jgi:hypothetical protein